MTKHPLFGYPVFDCPAFAAFKAPADVPVLRYGTPLAVFRHDTYSGSPRLAYAGDTRGYLRTLRTWDDEAIEARIAANPQEDEYWINLEATSLTAEPREKTAYLAVFVGQEVEYNGRRFSIERAGNGNYRLDPLDD